MTGFQLPHDRQSLHDLFQGVVEEAARGDWPAETHAVCRAVLKNRRVCSDLLPGYYREVINDIVPGRNCTYGAAARRVLKLASI
jgi:hypothetical protein